MYFAADIRFLGRLHPWRLCMAGLLNLTLLMATRLAASLAG